ncbi:hypothetical protein BU25DRAFT_424466 [Macroventuria anomochaeta]|uniref:Uncharacterized protein n=1 Tax=Macroventuria anomochaeta TaxID=301207 RepID=A0ACB6RS39_9PLEO|nr:uncharacterized protein BU25DRAFT_424466 [Macroventuria anomochaeta]KAF2624087.1 hypothetical protein BU25DRAFT_424466 [Macroventuria anomochaeta]
MYGALVTVSISITVAVTVWKYFIYPLFLSPLASVPAVSPIARFSALWIEWQRLDGKDFQRISAAFAAKGPYVLISPQELALNDMHAVNCVWGAGSAGFDKHPSYEYWATQGRVLPVLDRVASSPEGATRILPIAQSMSLDCTSAFAFGIPLSLDFVLNAKARREWLDLFATAFPTDQASFWLREHPRLTKYLFMLGVSLVSKDMAPARRKFEAWALPRVDGAEEVLKKRDMGQAIEAGQLPVLYDAIPSDLANSQMKGKKLGFTMTEAQRRELATFTAEAFGTVSTYMVYELSHHLEVQSELREELRSTTNPLIGADSPTDIPDSQSPEQLPLIGAVVKECLRRLLLIERLCTLLRE